MKISVRKICVCSVLITLAMILSYIEHLIPIPVSIPGVKIGLANIAIIFSLYYLKFADTLIISILRTVLISLIFTNPICLVYSVCGAVISLLLMYLLKKSDRFTVLGVSICGGVSHNTAQIIVASVLVKTYKISALIPALIVSGCIAGTFIGIVSAVIIKKMQKYKTVVG